MDEISDDLILKLKSIKAKRARTVINHILKHGFITTEDLSSQYGYDHPPRAARDVRENGIPLETYFVKGSHGRRVGAYKFGDLSKIKSGKLGGRKIWSKKFKQNLVSHFKSRCGICLSEYESRYLQIDHRVPYEVAGDTSEEHDLAEFMLVCGSCNRAKSWSCEHCENWTKNKISSICQTCYWATPENYSHIALRLIRRLDIIWSGKEVSDYNRLTEMSKHAKKELPEFVKKVLRTVKLDN